MIRRVAAILSMEFRVVARNRWLAVAIVMMIAFSLLIAVAGSAPVGTIAAERLTVTAASLGTLMVYLVPLMALLISYDSISGEASRGTLALLLVYPATRAELLAGKSIAQFLVIAIAIVAGTATRIVRSKMIAASRMLAIMAWPPIPGPGLRPPTDAGGSRRLVLLRPQGKFFEGVRQA